MSKIITAINTMITHENMISNAQIGTNIKEIFFLYNEKYKWSISINNENNQYFLYYYSGDETIEALASHEGTWEGTKYIHYSSKDLKTREAYESMVELYRIVKEKAYGVDQALNDIINGIP